MGKLMSCYLMPHAPILLPEIGDSQIKNIKSTFNACYEVASDIARIAPDTIIMITPHGPVFEDAIAISANDVVYGNFEQFGNEYIGMECTIEKNLTEKIASLAMQNKIPVIKINKTSAKVYGAFTELDHGSMVPLYFINKKHKNYKLVHITYGMISKIDLYKFGMIIKKSLEESNNNAILIASGDLSHCLSNEGPYDYCEDGEKFDKQLIGLLEQGDVVGIFNMDNLLVRNAYECGLRSCYIMLGVMNGYDIKGKLLSYEGPFGVGYGVMKFDMNNKKVDISDKIYETLEKTYQEKQKNSSPYIRLAQQSLSEYLNTGKYIDIPDYVTDDMLTNKRGVFVSIKKYGKLRGCIGTIFPETKSIANEIIQNAVSAGILDPRFMPIRESELKEIDFSVDILTEPELTTREILDPVKYGIIVKCQNKQGLLLPNLEGVNTIGEQIEIALSKAGIMNGEEYEIFRFEVKRYK